MSIMDAKLSFLYPNTPCFDSTELNSFNEFSTYVDELSLMIPPSLYLEGMQSSTKHGVINTLTQAGKNTVDTTKQTYRAWDNITDGGGILMKSVVDLFGSGINLSIKIINYCLEKISKLPRALGHLINKVGDIPADVRSKIRGDIRLYVTAKDISKLYTELIPDIKVLISILNQMSQGETWKRWRDVALKKTTNAVRQVKNAVSDTDEKVNLPESDMKLASKLTAAYLKIEEVDFQLTTVDLKDEETVRLYFDPTYKGITFRGSRTSLKHAGKTFNLNYYEALRHIVAELDNGNDDTGESFTAQIKNLSEAMYMKLEKTQISANFSQLNDGQQRYILDSVQKSQKVIGIIGKIVQTITKDIITMEQHQNVVAAKVEEIQKKNEPSSDESKKKEGEG